MVSARTLYNFAAANGWSSKKIWKMEKRKLGNSGIEIAPFTLGGNVFGWTIDEKTSFEVLDAFVAAGFQLVDTADVYSNWKPGNKGGESESIIGNWMKRRANRHQVLVATKAGGDMGSGKNLRKDYIIRAAEASLKRLQTDHIDLYQSHWDDLNTPVEEPLEAFAQLIAQGKVRAIGASNFSGDRLAEALRASEKNNLPRYQSFQPRYNLYDREAYEKEYEQICVGQHLGVIPYYGLASGFLTGKYRSEKDLAKSPRGEGVGKYLNPRGFKILAALDEVAQRCGLKPATVSLAWLIARPGITAPIASATSVDQLQDLVKAAQIKLDKEALETLNLASSY
jgi:aryl-alcohol dehydrogenase-like predicted oxidoreductase